MIFFKTYVCRHESKRERKHIKLKPTQKNWPFLEQNQAKATQLKKDSFHFRRRHRVNLGGSNFQGNLEDVQTFSPDRISYVLLLLKSF